MKTVVVYFSKFGNTELVAETIAEGLGGNGPVYVLNADAMAARDLEGVDLVVMGTPTHKMNLPEPVH